MSKYNILTRYFSLLLIAFLMYSCAPKMFEGNAGKLKRIKTSQLVSTLDSLSTRMPMTFYAKISNKYQDTNSTISFKNSIRLIRDSSLNSIITYAAIPIVNSLITPDSLKVVNKREKCVVRANLGFIAENFGVDFDYKNIEELLIGLPLDFDSTSRYFQINESNRYVLSSHRKIKIKRLDRKEKDSDRKEKDRDRDREKEKEKEEPPIVFKYFLDSTATQLTGMEIFSANDSTTVWVNYLNRTSIDGYSIPEETEIRIQMPRNNIFLKMSYNKVELNLPQEMYFIIPEGYEDCE